MYNKYPEVTTPYKYNHSHTENTQITVPPTTMAVGAITAIRLILDTPRKATHTTPIKMTWILTTTSQLM
jgi:hypothetical protein